MMGEDRPFGWAVLGLGKHTINYLAPAITASEHGRLVAIGSRDVARAAGIASDWGEVRVYDGLDGILADPRVDGVFISTPNHLHREQVERVAAAGKHVLCEKPLATTAADAAAMVAACRAAGVALGVGFHLRHNLVHRAAREAVASGRIGVLRFASIRYSHRTAPAPAGVDAAAFPAGPAAWRRDPALAGGGGFVSNGVHIIDLLRFLSGAEIASVAARADAAVGSERGLAASVALHGGALASLFAGDLPYPVNDVVLSGTEGTVHCTGSVGNAGAGRAVITTADGEEEFEAPEHDVYAREVDDFVARVRAGAEPDASGLDGLRSTEGIEAIYASARTGAATAPLTTEERTPAS